jgi:hypothetical protein
MVGKDSPTKKRAGTVDTKLVLYRGSISTFVCLCRVRMAIDYCLGAENETLAEIGESKLPPDKKKSITRRSAYLVSSELQLACVRW